MSNILIEAKNIRKEYEMGEEKVEAIKNMSLKVKEGEFISIIGPSGSGKSTLLHILGCLDLPSRGEYLYKGKEISTYSDDQLSDFRNREIGFVFQFFYLLPRENVLENVKLPLLYRDTTEKIRNDMAMKALEKVGMKKRKNHLPTELSGGERQRVAIARALVGDPNLILADEPTGNLDTKTGESIISIFEELYKTGKTIIMITHEKELAEKAEKIVKIRDGEIEGG
ncbi:ABC transporter ATP-binding protein [candidate division WOR-3 bacterium]|nr:ABC transporter ATP-binding protein [candidate division WOR-3 bacterium]